MDAACNFPEILALDLETTESLFPSKRMTSGAPRPMDAIFESQSIQDLGLDLGQLNHKLNNLSLEEASSILNSLGNLSALNNLNSLSSLSNPATLAYTSSPRNFLPGKTAPSGQNHTHNQPARQDHHARSKSTTHAIPNDLASYLRQSQYQHQHRGEFSNFDDVEDTRLSQRPTTAGGIVDHDRDRGNSPGPVFSISRSKTKQQRSPSYSSSAVPRYAAGTGVNSTAAATHHQDPGHNTTGEWDTDSVDSFELPNIRLSRRNGGPGEGVSGQGRGGQGSESKSSPAPQQSMHERVQHQEDEQIQHWKQLQQLKQLRQLQQLQQQLQEKQQLQSLLEKQLMLQQKQEQKLMASHKDKEEDSTRLEQKEQSQPKATKKGDSVRKEQTDDTPSHLPQQTQTHLPAHTTPLLPQQKQQKQQMQQMQQNHLSVDAPSNYGHRDSYGSLYDSYNYGYHRYSHDSNRSNVSAITNTDIDDGASSIAGGGGGGGGGPRGRQQSVVTMATSVTSSGGPGCRFSSQSTRTTPSALGQYAKSGLAGSSQRESVATTASSGDRHVEFSLDTSRRGSTKAVTDNTSDGSDDVASGVQEENASKVKSAQDKEYGWPLSRNKSNNREGAVSQSSWMRFDDDDDNDGADADKDETYSDIKNTTGVSSNRPVPHVDSAAESKSIVISPVNFGGLPQRPKTAVGPMNGAPATDFRAINDHAAEKQNGQKIQALIIPGEPVSSTFTDVPQRLSSLSHQDRKALPIREHDSEQQNKAHHNHEHKLRHFLSFSDVSVFSEAPRGRRADALNDRPRTSSSSQYQMRPDYAVTERRSRFDTESIVDPEEPPVLLEKTVYRKPVARTRTPLDMPPIQKAAHKSTPSEHLIRRGREVFSVTRSGVNDNVGDNTHDASKQPFVEPLLVSQFDDDSDGDHHTGAASDHDDDDDCEIEKHLAENDADLFGDFEGAYNYDEGQDKIMLATMMPFSKQPPRSVRSIRSVSPGRPLDALPELHERPVIASVAALVENPEETSSHLQSWIEHASKSQLELAQEQQQQQQKQHSRSAAPRTREAIYDDDDQHADEARDVVPESIEAPNVRPRTAPNAAAPEAASPSAAATTGQYELQSALQQAQPVPLQFFSQPGTVGIPLPREVVDTLRVSVSCFPETMLNLSSFSIQTIRTYSRKVRRCSQTDADSTYRLLMAPQSPGTLPPSPTSMAHGIPPLSPTSPTSMSFDLGTGVSRTMTAPSLASNSSHRFWKLPKKIANNTRSAAPNLHLFTNFRSSNSSSNIGGLNDSSNKEYPASPTASMTPSMPRLSTTGRHGSSRTENNFMSMSSGGIGEGDQQGKASFLSLKRIFPTGSDYLCEALYAHIIAFNYISLLCPPPPSAASEDAAAGVDARVVPGVAQPSSSDAVTTSHTMTTVASSATLIETTQQQRRQTIRIYVGSDVPLPAMSDDGPSSSDHGTRSRHQPLEELDEMRLNANTSSRLLSMSSSRPPSRGYSAHDNNDDARMISRKAALLLGITETLEPETASMGGPSSVNGHGRGKKPSTASGGASELSSPTSLRSSSLVRRYNSMRRRMAQSISESAEAAAASAADPNDHSFAARATRAAVASKMIMKSLPGSISGGNNNSNNYSKPKSVEISKPFYEAADVPIPTEGVPATVAAATAAAVATAASDASMRDLHAGLHACISQLVATMKLTTGQLGNTLLNTEAARAIDPLFLRTLCELVRSQEEQF
ncbi:uncharacterized protein SPSK_08292 [Sporothrix schenckii 1099-18]|uniref:Uncharacterized protein n=1 Tax=Sporothrix schenckii 1099-18 TaxID=1397361 RepID=A0A0F2M9W3_SPOSC|nr:uncharacterized protein SPSK_08292 [Sporothrix schenckii 1099-18]KJR85615.1 hypothetical protein SPSK_08292 [Sporothrix schenckii 1099-18]